MSTIHLWSAGRPWLKAQIKRNRVRKYATHMRDGIAEAHDELLDEHRRAEEAEREARRKRLGQ